MKPPSFLFAISAVALSLAPLSHAEETGSITFKGSKGPGAGKKVVLLAGDEEYRSEQSMPMLAKILSAHHGFTTTVLFSTGTDGTIDPNAGESITHPEALDSADAIVMLLRFRKWPDAAMKHFDDAIKRGVPVIALRTSTHAFQLPGTSAFKDYNGFGKKTLGEQWVNHWGKHKAEATRGVIEATNAKNPLLNGVKDIFGDSDVYEAAPPDDATILLRGQVLSGMTPDSAPASYSKKTAKGVDQPINDPMMPIAWTREVKNPAGTTNKILCTTMGAASDLQCEDLRRLVINGVYWGTGLKIPEKANAATIGAFQGQPYGFNGFQKGVTPASLAK